MGVEKERPEEIEITPEMIDAGTRAKIDFDQANWSDEETHAVLAEVHRTMVPAKGSKL